MHSETVTLKNTASWHPDIVSGFRKKKLNNELKLPELHGDRCQCLDSHLPSETIISFSTRAVKLIVTQLCHQMSAPVSRTPRQLLGT
jgi:hypothetical protein